jgi:hypothetical protein
MSAWVGELIYAPAPSGLNIPVRPAEYNAATHSVDVSAVLTVRW